MKEIIHISASAANQHPFVTPFINLRCNKGISVAFDFTVKVDAAIAATIVLRDPTAPAKTFNSRTLPAFNGVVPALYVVTIYPGVFESGFDQISMALPCEFAFSLSGAAINNCSINGVLLP